MLRPCTAVQSCTRVQHTVTSFSVHCHLHSRRAAIPSARVFVGTPTDRQAVVHADGPYVLGHSLLGLQVIEGVTHTLDGTGQRSTRRPLSRTPLKIRSDTTVPYRKGREFARMPFLHGRPADFGSHAFSCICACAPAYFNGAIGFMHRCGACQLALMMRPSAFTRAGLGHGAPGTTLSPAWLQCAHAVTVLPLTFEGLPIQCKGGQYEHSQTLPAVPCVSRSKVMEMEEHPPSWGKPAKLPIIRCERPLSHLGARSAYGTVRWEWSSHSGGLV